MRRVFISYRSQEPDTRLAQKFRKSIMEAGHDCFMARENLKLGDNWAQRISLELERCDYFLLLLSPQAAASDMVTEEVRRAKSLHDTRPDKRPVILRVDVGLPPDGAINYDIASYLARFQRTEWRSEADTRRISASIIEVIASNSQFLPTTDEPASSRLRNKALPASLYHSLRKLLIEECEEFANHAQLVSLFEIENLSIWRPYLPPPGSLNMTVDKVIGELAKKNKRTGENALASLLTVLAERRDPDDQVHSQLLDLSRWCQQALSGS